jgi:hypothetical protein
MSVATICVAPARRAGDQHALAEQRPGTVDGVQRHRQRLGHRAFAVADMVCQLVRLAGVADDALAEGALHMRHAHCAAVVAHVQAVVVLALLAIAALAAGPARADGHALAGREAGHGAAHRLDAACDLVAQHHRLLDAHRAEAAVLEVMQVRTADAAGAHAHLQLVWLEWRRVDFFDPQVAGGMYD